jgi:hypothetical protein
MLPVPDRSTRGSQGTAMHLMCPPCPAHTTLQVIDETQSFLLPANLVKYMNVRGLSRAACLLLALPSLPACWLLLMPAAPEAACNVHGVIRACMLLRTGGVPHHGRGCRSRCPPPRPCWRSLHPTLRALSWHTSSTSTRSSSGRLSRCLHAGLLLLPVGAVCFGRGREHRPPHADMLLLCLHSAAPPSLCPKFGLLCRLPRSSATPTLRRAT